MLGSLFSNLASLASIIVSLMIVAALAILWNKHRSIWLVVAIVAELVGLAFRAAVAVMPELVRTMPVVFSLWSLSALVFAIGLLAYAIEIHQRSDR